MQTFYTLYALAPIIAGAIAVLGTASSYPPRHFQLKADLYRGGRIIHSVSLNDPDLGDCVMSCYQFDPTYTGESKEKFIETLDSMPSLEKTRDYLEKTDANKDHIISQEELDASLKDR